MNSDSLQEDPIDIEISIVYHPSYQAPTLYFLMKRNGVYLSYDEILQDIPLKPDNQFIFLTQGEHPVIGRIMFYIHPCQTLDFMAEVRSYDYSIYLEQWLIFYSSFLGIHW
jgi:hypothetical protein